MRIVNIIAAILKFYREWAWFFWIGAWWVAVFLTMYCIGEADGATGSAQRSMVVEQEISGIVARVIGGSIGDVLASTSDSVGEKRGWDLPRRAKEAISDVALTIDGQPRTGWRAWAAAGYRVGSYVADCRDSGSVGYSYRLRVRGYVVRRETIIEDGSVLLTTDAWWVERVPVGRSTRRLPIHVSIVIRATENSGSVYGTKTLLVGTAIGTAATNGFRCSIVRRIAERQAAETLDRELAAALRTLQQRGTDWYHGANGYTDILDGIGDAMRTVGRLRR